MKKQFTLLFSILFASLLAFTGCSSMAAEDKGDLTIVLPGTPTRDISDINFKVSLCDIKETELLSKSGKSGETIVFEQILIGNYVIKIECFDLAGNSIGKGTSQCTVEAGKTTNVKLKIKLYGSEDHKPDLDPIPGEDPDPNPGTNPDPIPGPEPEPEPTPEEPAGIDCTMTITIEFKPYEEAFTLTASEDGRTLTTAEGFSEYNWFVDGIKDSRTEATGNTYTNESLVGKHSITLMAKNAEGKIYSASQDVCFSFKEEHVGKLLLENKTVTSEYDETSGIRTVGLIYQVENQGTEENYAKVLGLIGSSEEYPWLNKISQDDVPVNFPSLMIECTNLNPDLSDFVYGDFSGGLTGDASNVYEVICAEDPEVPVRKDKYPGFYWAHRYGTEFLLNSVYQNGWYMPAIDEMISAFAKYSASSESIKAAFTANASDFDTYDEFMTASIFEENGKYKFMRFVVYKSDVSQAYQTDKDTLKYKVRAFRKVSVQE
ncbi:MAG: hypothetical protein KBT11_09465 [Treponema sp.]|nr:hypothetical protein [Candidatus Treponema equifaecale]